MLTRRLLTIFSTAIVILLLSSTAALAHFCFNPSRSATGTQHAAESSAWLSLEELLHLLVEEGELPPLCDVQIMYIVDTVDPDRAFATHAITVVASGQNANNPQLSDDDRGIDHLFTEDPDNPGHTELVDAVFAALGEALATVPCP